MKYGRNEEIIQINVKLFESKVNWYCFGELCYNLRGSHGEMYVVSNDLTFYKRFCVILLTRK